MIEIASIALLVGILIGWASAAYWFIRGFTKAMLSDTDDQPQPDSLGPQSTE